MVAVGIQRQLAVAEVTAEEVKVAATVAVDTLSQGEVEVGGVGMDSRTQRTLCMEQGLWPLLK